MSEKTDQPASPILKTRPCNPPTISPKRFDPSNDIVEIGINIKVEITGGKHLGELGVISKITPKMCYIIVGSTDKPILVHQKHVKITSSCLESNVVSSSPTLPNISNVISGSPNKMFFGDHHIQKITSSKNEDKYTCFLKIWLSEYSILENGDADPQMEMIFNNMTYSLISTKPDKTSNGLYSRGSCVSIYAGSKNQNHRSALVNDLNKLADFEGLKNPRKIAARLQMLQSQVLVKNVHALHCEQFEMIEEPQPSEDSGGCGFIPDDMLTNLIGGRIVGKRSTSIQVRIFSPKLGLFKGVLTRKKNITKIQLPPSMKKVGPSKIADAKNDKVFLLIKNVFPSQNNLTIGKWINGQSFAKSFTQKALSAMIIDMFKMVGIPSKIIENYKKPQREEGNIEEENNRLTKILRKEAWVIGIADPTDAIPEGHVYITGFSNVNLPTGKVFVTRSPCVLPGDCRLIPVIETKPADMDQEQWEYLASRPMGEIIFHNKKPFSEGIGLPMMTGQGDLDGDLYFICWDENIITHCAIPINQDADHRDSGDIFEYPFPEIYSESDADDWLRKSQVHMTDPRNKDDKKFIGKLYNELKSGKHNAHDNFLLGMAYKECIDGQKHGGKIKLPDSLAKKIGF